MSTIKNVTEERKKKLQSLIGFLSANKIDNYKGGGGEGRKKIQSNLQSKSKNQNNVFLESLLSESFPLLGVTVHLTSLGCPPCITVYLWTCCGAVRILIWSYSCLFMAPVSTAIRTSAFSFVGALNDLSHIP